MEHTKNKLIMENDEWIYEKSKIHHFFIKNCVKKINIFAITKVRATGS